ncbi:MAG: hypothetical protein Q9162_003282 [Coniocarpon cinnabarinum]
MPYPTTRDLNERLQERQVPRRVHAHQKNVSLVASPPFSPRKALEQAKQSKLPLPTSPTKSPTKSLSSPKSRLGLPNSPTLSSVTPPHLGSGSRRTQMKRADDSWLKGKQVGMDARSVISKPVEERTSHARKRSENCPAPSVIPREALVVPSGKLSELPNTLLRRHILAREPAVTGRFESTDPATLPKSSASQSADPAKRSNTLPDENRAFHHSGAAVELRPEKDVPKPNPKTLRTIDMATTARSEDAQNAVVQARAGSSCKQKGHPYTSHFIPYLCEPCVAASQERERDRRQRLEASLADNGLIERVKLEEWQWRTKFNAGCESKEPCRPRAKGKTDPVPDTNGKAGEGAESHTGEAHTGEDSIKDGEKEEQKRLKEEAEMLVKMEEANRQLEEAMASRRRSDGVPVPEKGTARQSWVQGLRRSWGSESKVEVGAERLTGGKGRASWRVSRWPGREEY